MSLDLRALSVQYPRVQSPDGATHTVHCYLYKSAKPGDDDVYNRFARPLVHLKQVAPQLFSERRGACMIPLLVKDL